jgi:hypothetical protein
MLLEMLPDPHLSASVPMSILAQRPKTADKNMKLRDEGGCKTLAMSNGMDCWESGQRCFSGICQSANAPIGCVRPLHMEKAAVTGSQRPQEAASPFPDPPGT